MIRIHFGCRFLRSLATPAIMLGLLPQMLCAQAVQNKESDPILIPDGTPVHLVLMDDLQGRKLQVKQTVHFEVREDLVVQSHVIVKTGSGAIGHIESVSKSGLFGKSGKLVLHFDFVLSAAAARIPIRGGAGVNGGKGGALTWESAMWYGPDAKLAVGTMINAFVDGNQRISPP
jgi:hypothetical protein